MAWLLLLLMVSFSATSSGNVSPYGWPAPLRIPALVTQAFFQLWPMCIFLFGIYFPYRSRPDVAYPWAKWILLTPLGAFFALTVLRNIGISESYESFRTVIKLQSRLAGLSRIAGMTAVCLFFRLWR